MSCKKPRNRENYPKQSISLVVKVKPAVYDWIDEAKWTFRDTRSGLAAKMLMFAYDNLSDFEKYYQGIPTNK